jgi:hypothetical protein
VCAGDCCKWLGHSYLKAGDGGKAAAAFAKGCELAEQSGNKRLQVRPGHRGDNCSSGMLHSTSVVNKHCRSGDVCAADLLFSAALVFRHAGTCGTAVVVTVVSGCHNHTSSFTHASSPSLPPPHKVDCLSGLGTMHRDLGQSAPALGFLSQALRVASELGEPPLRASVLTLLGTVMMGSDGSAAIVHLEEAVGIREDQVRVGGGAGEGRGGRRFA